MQILVVVANTPERPWRTDVEKGSVCFDKIVSYLQCNIEEELCICIMIIKCGKAGMLEAGKQQLYLFFGLIKVLVLLFL